RSSSLPFRAGGRPCSWRADRRRRRIGAVACTAAWLVASVVTGRPDPGSWLPAPRAPAETPTLGPASAAIPTTIGDRLRPFTIEAIRSIQPLQQTAAANLVLESSLSLSGRRC